MSARPNRCRRYPLGPAPLLLGLLVALLLAACAQKAPRSYFTLRYPMPRPRHVRPFPYTVRVKDLSISSTYSSNRLVFRRDVHQIQYRSARRWTERPERMVTELLRKHLRHAGVVQQVTERLGEKEPDYILLGEVEAIEELDAGDYSYAHLAFTARLVRFEDNTVVYARSFDRRIRIPAQSGRALVRALSSLLEQEADKLISDLSLHFEHVVAGGEEEAVATMARELVDVGAGSTFPYEVEGPPAPDYHRPISEAAAGDVPGLFEDDTPMPPGKGAIFLSALSSSSQEPLMAVYRDGEEVVQGRMGRRIPVEPGEYEVRYGSGTVEQQLAARVVVEEGRVTPVVPDWAALELKVVDQRSVPFRGSYELIYMPTREEYGVGFGAEEELAEQLRVWVLRPGLYKVVRAGGTYRDRTNFATVLLEPGKLTRFTLVQYRGKGDPTLDEYPDGAFLGAGVVQDSDTGLTRGAWKLSALFGGDANFQQSNATEDAEGWDLRAGLFFDGRLQYLQEPHHFFTRLDIEEKQRRLSATERFDNVSDRLYLPAIYTYHLIPGFGPYAAFRLETRLLPSYKDFDEPRTLSEYDEDGALVRTYEQVDRVQLAGTLSGLQLRPGVGGNLHAIQRIGLDLNLRAGIGGKQTFAIGLLDYQEESSPRLEQKGNVLRPGLEAALVLLARVSRWATITSEFEGFLPFNGLDESYSYDWRNQLSLRLVSFASVNYTLQLKRDPDRGWEEHIIEQYLQLRFSYALF